MATDNPAFNIEEMQFAENSVVTDPWRGHCDLTPDNEHGQLRKSIDGPLYLYETPQPKHHYFIGVDSARCEEFTLAPADYAALGCINAETGHVAAIYAARVSPEELSSIAAALGFYFNSAMLNVELNNIGYITMRELRDHIHYPNQYIWKGRDDKASTSESGTAYGFETSDRYRRTMFNLYRTALHRQEVVPKDKALVSQMKKAKMEMGWRWNVAVGHDGILMSILLAYIAKEQYHPTSCQPKISKNALMAKEELENAGFDPARGHIIANGTPEVPRSSENREGSIMSDGSKFVGETCWPVDPAYSEHGGHTMLLCEDGQVLQIVHPPAAQIEYVNVIDPIVRELVKSKIQLEKGK